MTEVEAFELVLLASANGNTSFAMYITFITAYLIATHFVGHKLPLFQAIMLSGLFLLAALLAMMNMYGDIKWWEVAVTHSGDTAPIGISRDTEFVEIVFMTFMGIGIVSSLYFMWYVRRNMPD